MACPAVTTGQGFLLETLGHLDCQAQVIGSFGFTSLADPASPASTLLTALLTLFVALFGVRLLFGGRVATSDAVGAVLKIGIVLTLALSWPAYRTLAYDTVLHGPAEIAGAIGGDTLPDMSGGLAARLQGIDDGIVSLTALGAGRQTGALAVPGEDTGSFQGIALQDESGLAYGRTLFLGAALGSLAILRIAAALLLALAPVIAGLLLFDVTRGVFAGWLRGLVLIVLGSVGISVLLAVEIAVMEPWLADALNRRTLGYATPGAPTELLAMSLGFALAAFGLLALLAKVAFQNAWQMPPAPAQAQPEAEPRPAMQPLLSQRHDTVTAHSRALAVGEGVMATMRREESSEQRRISDTMLRGERPAPSGADNRPRGGPDPLGSSWRRNSARVSSARQHRDRS